MIGLPEPVRMEASDAALDAVPNRPAVFLIQAQEGSPYLARTNVLQRRLRRLLGVRGRLSKLVDLRSVAREVEYWLTGSRLEAAVIQYELARHYFPEDYARQIKLPKPSYVRLLEGNRFPRTQVTTRLGSSGLCFGPFRSRAAAELFDHDCLDLFQIRRCQEDLDPSPEHAGCMYGEMNLCLRPCQTAVSEDEYASEVRRLREFLTNEGRTLIETIEHARDRCSEEMLFEEAARQHRRLERVQAVLKLRDELARDIDHLHGIAVLPSVEADAVELLACQAGTWQAPRRFSFAQMEGKSIDERIRSLLGEARPRIGTRRERQDHLALLARWFHSSWRDGAWIAHGGEIPYRRLGNAMSRVLRGGR